MQFLSVLFFYAAVRAEHTLPRGGYGADDQSFEKLLYQNDAPECSSYTVLNEANRRTSFIDKRVALCDSRMDTKWYRFSVAVGNVLPDSCVEKNRCGTHAPGWLNGTHPTVAEGVVSRIVCYHWRNDCCNWRSKIKARNCGGYFVYELSKPPACNLRYCGGPARIAQPECSSYTILNEANRRTSFLDKKVALCDSRMDTKWYRFSVAAGSYISDWCVDKYRCGTYAPGWLNGKHPTVAEGVVSRVVCYHWGNDCCQWVNNIRVRNCGGFYVYELSKPPDCNLRYCGGPAKIVQPGCSSYTVLNEVNRRTSFLDKKVALCDSRMDNKWYRFSYAAGNSMPDSCVDNYRCGTFAPGWMNGTHPTVAEGVVSRVVCYHWGNDCCNWRNNIKVRNCGGYFVYELSKPPACNLRYCGGPAVIAQPECSSYTVLNEANRRASFLDSKVALCDRRMDTKWYRFSVTAGSSMPDSCVDNNRCGTHAPGWMNGKHPTVAEGVVSRVVCYHWGDDCCNWRSTIKVRNCGGYFVYELSKPPKCQLRYCGGPVRKAQPECSSYTVLNEANRQTSFIDKRVALCDSRMDNKWYRFSYEAGNSMPDSCVDNNHCGTHAPGWLNGKHPTVAEGVVSRVVCYHWGNDCCNWRNNIKVRNCGGYFVYELRKPPMCQLRYCGGPARIAQSECSSYTVLNEANRQTSFIDKNVALCDNIMDTKWYRFSVAAGSSIPDWCVDKYRCGTHAPGWMNGTHPTVAEGVVSRVVCYHWGDDCCNWRSTIGVRNCGGYFVYELSKPPACQLRYCGGLIRKAPRISGEARVSSKVPVECSSYTVLDELNRQSFFLDKNVTLCDSNLATKWYRFSGESGDSMAASCVNEYHCGTHAPGWLNGKHPIEAEGVVSRVVCYHWDNHCCRWENNIRVRNCGGYFVYELSKPPACPLRYCGGPAISEPRQPHFLTSHATRQDAAWIYCSIVCSIVAMWPTLLE